MGDTEVMVIKFKFRKNIRGGCVLIRPFLSAETHDKARLICPGHTFWTPVANTCGVNKPLFTTLHANSVNQHIKAAMVKLNYDQGHRYRPMPAAGDTEEIKHSGSTFAAIIKSGTCTASGCKIYLDVQADEAINISKLLLDTSNPDSDDADPDSPPVEQKLRRKVTKIPPAPRREKPLKLLGSAEIAISEASETSD